MNSIDTTKIYTNAFGDSYFQEINQKAFDNVGASSTFHKIFNKSFEKEKHLYLIVGSDSGLLIPYLQKFHSGKGRHYLVFDTPEMIEYLENHIEFDDTLISITPYDVQLEDLLEPYIDYTAHQRYTLLRSLGVIDNKCEPYREMWEDLYERFNLYSQSELGYAINNIFVDSQLRNLSQNTVPASKIKHWMKDATSIILGGGPTLDENIDWIRDNQQHLIIFAAARIANRLKREGIQPDFFVTVDPNDVSYDNSKAILEFPGDPILIHANNANTKLLSEWTHKHTYLGDAFPWKDSDHDQPDNLIVIGPTVTNTMASVAAYFNSKQIIFSGVDFCHSASGSSHESGSLESSTGKYLKEANNRVETYSGRIADTTPSFANAKRSMEELVNFAQGSNQNHNQFYSISQEAAKLDKVSYIKAKEIELPNENKQEIMDKIHEALTVNLADYRKHLDYAKNYSQEMRQLCRDAIKLSKEGKKLAKMLFKDLDETDQLTQKLIGIKNDLEQTLGEHAMFIFNYSIKSYKDFMDPSISNETMDKDEIKTSFINYFDGIIQSSQPLKKSIETGIQRLNHRIEETKGLKSFNKIVENWKNYDEPGRPYVWLNMHHLEMQDLSSEQQAAVQTLLDKYQEELTRTETKLSAELKVGGLRPDFLLKQLRRFFREQRETEMAELISYIRDQQGPNAEDLVHIGNGFLYEMQGMQDEALDAYVQVQDKTILFHALSQIANITLTKGDYDNALNALEVLTHYSDDYFVTYADIIAAMGQGKDAVEIYKHYLDKHDDDIGTWIKLAKLLIHLGIIEEALNVIDKINELEPDSPVANELILLIEKQA